MPDALRWSSPLLLLGVITLAGSGAAQPVASGYKHLGAASCASSVCHGKVSPQAGPNQVPLNEYRIWFNNDRHRQAYLALESTQSRQIAAKLGLPNAVQPICLGCHADDVPKTLQGAKYNIRDGVSCEACHGGSEKWIEAHAQKGATHAGNVAQGLYPSEQPLRRAELCLSCHLGTRDKFATHTIMGAGHPRLYFELGAFTEDQPPHFKVTPYYESRKGKIAVVNLWLTGQLENAERYLALLQAPSFTPGGMVPELALYDCNACHHIKEKMHWSEAHAGAGVKPGSLRLQRQSFVMLQAFLEASGAQDAATQLSGATDALIRAGSSDAAAVRSAAQKLTDQLRGLEPWAKREYTREQITQVRRLLVHYAALDRASDYATAEQVVLGVQTLTFALGESDRAKDPKGALKALFASLGNGAEFNAAQFVEVSKKVEAQFST
jgi:hypothetical protein